MKKRKKVSSSHIRVGALISGGKDSLLALHRAKAKGCDIKCLITIRSHNPDSYMFHSPNTHMIKEIAQALNIPLIEVKSEGKKEVELKDLEKAIIKAKEKYKIEGVISGAVKSTYQATRIQKVLDKLHLWSINPLWQNDELKLLEEMVKNKFEIYIVRVAAYPLNEKWLGKRITHKEIEELKKMNKEYGISIIGEGGEYETFVSSAPYFSKKIVIKEWEKRYSQVNYEGVGIIKRYTVENKKIYSHIPTRLTAEIPKNNAKEGKVLIIKTNTLDIHDYEFVEPIAHIIKKTLNTSPHLLPLYKLSTIPTNTLKKYTYIVITGTALHDPHYFPPPPQIKEKIRELAATKNIAGIGWGGLILYLSITPHSKLRRIKRIGMRNITPITKEKNRKDPSITPNKAYFLHKVAFPSQPHKIWMCKYVINKNKKCVAIIKKNNKKKNNKVIGILFHPEVLREDVIEEFLLKS